MADRKPLLPALVSASLAGAMGGPALYWLLTDWLPAAAILIRMGGH